MTYDIQKPDLGIGTAGRVTCPDSAFGVCATREAWLGAAAGELRRDFRDRGYDLPDKIRFALAFPSTGRFGKRIGECWTDKASSDGAVEIFIRVDQDDPVEVLAILVHELVHAAVGTDAKHGPIFKRCALAVGLKGPMRHTRASPALVSRLQEIVSQIGKLPHGALDISIRRKQSTRLLKAQCKCGYTVRIARAWAVRLGAACPLHGAITIHCVKAEASDEAV